MASKPITREVRGDLAPDDWLFLEGEAMRRGKVGRQLVTEIVTVWCAHARAAAGSNKGVGGAPAGAGVGRSGGADA